MKFEVEIDDEIINLSIENWMIINDNAEITPAEWLREVITRDKNYSLAIKVKEIVEGHS